MMLADYNWQGLDGLGKALNVHVQMGNSANAFWDGKSASFTDGDCNYGPLTTLEVVGHEFTHGMIEYTSGLVYSSESGAINESLADMFGKMLERKSDPANFSWDLGHSVLLDPTTKPFRMMADPNALGMPAFYKGLYWEDFNEVHTNSSIGNLWFSMLVDGKQGTNELGVNYNVPGLGMDKAGQIVFENNRRRMLQMFGGRRLQSVFSHKRPLPKKHLFGPCPTWGKNVAQRWRRARRAPSHYCSQWVE
jgi:Zn-dependent metalloprotease